MRPRSPHLDLAIPRHRRPRPALVALLLALLVPLAACGESRPEPTLDVSDPLSLASPPAEVPPKVLIIGLDGLDLRKVTELWKRGRIPHLTKLMRAGVTSRLATVANASPVVWTSVATGVVPEKHGIQSFRARVVPGSAMRPVASTMRKAPAIWNILSHYDHTVGILGWWASFPAEKVNGYLVSPYVLLQPPREGKARVGQLWQEGDPRKTYPPELLNELGSMMYLAEDVDLSKVPHLYADDVRTTNTPWLIAKDFSYYEMALYQLRNHPVELAAVYFQAIDGASHDLDRWVYGKNMNKVREPKVDREEVEAAFARVDAMYEHADAFVGGLVAQTSPDTDVIVVSDHGWNYDGTSHWDWQNTPGVFIAAGPSFRPQGEVPGLSVVDITPIVLTILGVPLSRQFDGKVPEGLLREDLMARQAFVDDYGIPPCAVPEGTGTLSEEDAMMQERLRSLGYIGGKDD